MRPDPFSLRTEQPELPVLPSRRFWRPAATWVVLGAGLLATFIATLLSLDPVRQSTQDRFNRRIEKLSQSITNRMLAYEQVLKGAAGMFAASLSVERDEWRAYVSSLELDRLYPGIFGLGYIENVRPENLEQFLNATRADGAPAFQIHPDGVRPRYYVVKYVEPREHNESSMGDDISVDAARREAAERASDAGRAALTSRLRLNQGSGDAHAVLLLMPIYRGGRIPATVEERRLAMTGWVYGAFVMTNLMYGVRLDENDAIDFEIFDGAEAARAPLLFDNDGVPSTALEPDWRTLEETLPLAIAGQTWTVRCRTRPAFHIATDYTVPRLMAAGGLCISLLIFAITRAQVATRQRAERIARRTIDTMRLQERAILSSDNMIFTIDATRPDFPITYINPATERITGYSEEEFLGRNADILVGNDRDQPDLARVRDALFHGRECRAVIRNYRKDGTLFWNQFSLLPVRDKDGQVTHFVGIAEDITDRKRSEQALRDSRSMLQAILDNSPAVIYVKNAQGRYILINRVFEHLFHVNRESVQNRTDYDLFPREMAAAFRANDQEVLRAGRPLQLEEIAPHDDGPHTYISTKFPLRDSDGSIYALCGISTDISQRKHGEEELQRATRAAEAASRSKSEFLANMSHEIRTPMNAVIGMAELALDTPLSREQRSYLTAVRQSATDLMGVINDILDFSKIEAGKLEINAESFRLREMLDLCLNAFRFRAREKHLELALRVRADVPDVLVGDVGRLRQILVNLVGNAIKFTERGEVVVEVLCAGRRDAEAGSGTLSRQKPRSEMETQKPDGEAIELEFTVTDTGIGIPEDKQEAIFEAFTQADSSITRHFGGTGLGLAISTRLAGMMGGRIWVESEPARGSRFHFTVALQTSSAAVPLSEPPPALAFPLPATIVRRPLRLLVAEDNPVNRGLITAVLRNLGHVVEVVGNGRQTLEALEPGGFDAVLMDVQMPVLDGIETTREIRRRESEPPAAGSGKGRRRLPIIALTAHAMKGDREQCLAAGMDDYLAKPVRRPDLLAVLDRLVPAEEAPAPGSAAPAAPFHPDGLLAELNGDQAAMRRLITVFLETTPPLLDQLRKALHSGDREALGSAAHTLKGSLAQFSELRGCALATELERLASNGDWPSVSPLVAGLDGEITRFSADLQQYLSPLLAAADGPGPASAPSPVH